LILVDKLVSSAHIKKVIFVFDATNHQFLMKFNGIMEAERELNIRHEVINKYIQLGTAYNGYLFSHHRLISIN